MFTAAMPPEHNLLIDDHIIYALILIFFTVTNAGKYIGFGRVWEQTLLVRRYPWLK